MGIASELDLRRSAGVGFRNQMSINQARSMRRMGQLGTRPFDKEI
jgi:hypothetical protein